jgi:hypothetical protein
LSPFKDEDSFLLNVWVLALLLDVRGFVEFNLKSRYHYPLLAFIVFEVTFLLIS